MSLQDQPPIYNEFHYDTTIVCSHCDGLASLTRIMRDLDPRDEAPAEVRLFVCGDCGHHNVRKVLGC
jgi:hypothetical protein